MIAAPGECTIASATVQYVSCSQELSSTAGIACWAMHGSSLSRVIRTTLDSRQEQYKLYTCAEWHMLLRLTLPEASLALSSSGGSASFSRTTGRGVGCGPPLLLLLLLLPQVASRVWIWSPATCGIRATDSEVAHVLVEALAGVQLNASPYCHDQSRFMAGLSA